MGLSREEMLTLARTKALNSIYTRSKMTPEMGDRAVLYTYREFIDFQALSEPESPKAIQYKKRFNLVSQLIKSVKVDWSRPVLFHASEDISRELFLVALLQRKRISTYYVTNVIRIVDVYWGSLKKENPKITEDEMYYSEQDIKEDAMLVYGDVSMGTWKRPESLWTTLSSRLNMATVGGRDMGNILFFRGLKSALRTVQGFDLTFNHFEGMKSKGYQIIDLMSSPVWPGVEREYSVYVSSGEYVKASYTEAHPLEDYVSTSKIADREGDCREDEQGKSREREMERQRDRQAREERACVESGKLDDVY